MAKGQGRKIEDSFVPARKKRVVVLEDCNFVRDGPELEEITKMWKEGISIFEMGEQLERDPDEVLLAIVHLARKDRIMTRTGGGLGWI
jgi:hypothetical protein